MAAIGHHTDPYSGKTTVRIKKILDIFVFSFLIGLFCVSVRDANKARSSDYIKNGCLFVSLIELPKVSNVFVTLTLIITTKLYVVIKIKA
jgi:hypothetical protein